jgi:hypothetical protein
MRETIRRDERKNKERKKRSKKNGKEMKIEILKKWIKFPLIKLFSYKNSKKAVLQIFPSYCIYSNSNLNLRHSW